MYARLLLVNPTLARVGPRSPCFQTGFTLTELAIVMLIVALLIGGLLVPLAAQVEAQRTSEAEKALEVIRDSLLGFAVANGRLPCPAAANVPSGSIGAGLESGCANNAGVLPWATLGVPETDPWGNRYSYRVVPEFTRTVPQATFPTCATAPALIPQYSAFALCSKGNLTVLSTGGGSTVASDIPVVFISHGKNGNGAYTSLGTQLAVSADPDELDNQLTSGGTTTANVNFVNKIRTDTFDDVVAWISPYILYNRMIAAGKLP